ncbi:MAG TPA: hypothetical protein VMT17_19340 [Anaeromyxobacteraceae bacterium]|nr:hypothetical protein [Anaeromyxobacteraceae bacterium]
MVAFMRNEFIERVGLRDCRETVEQRRGGGSGALAFSRQAWSAWMRGAASARENIGETTEFGGPQVSCFLGVFVLTL